MIASLVDRVCVHAAAALGWWIEGLWLGVPPRLRRHFRPRDRIVVRIDRTITVETLPADGETQTPASTLTLDASEPDDRLAGSLCFAASADVTVVLPPTIGLNTTLRLPASAEPALRSVLAHELDRLTPFAIDEVSFDSWIRERDAERLVVEVAVARKEALASFGARLTRLGLERPRVTVADRDGRPLPLNLSPRRHALRLPFEGLPINPRIAAVAALALLLALFAPLFRYHRVLNSYDAEVSALRTEAVAARAALAEEEATLARADFIGARRAGYIAPLPLLLELTRGMPEHTWLSRLWITPTDVQLQGESAAAPDLLRIVESMDRLEGAQFQSPLARNDQTGKEQFMILAKPAKAAPP